MGLLFGNADTIARLVYNFFMILLVFLCLVLPLVFLYCCIFSTNDCLRYKKVFNRPKTYKRVVIFAVLTALSMLVSIAFAINGTK